MSKILQLKIVLDGITPKIWRRFLVKDNIPFEDLHEIIQIVMGWDNYHLYEFKIENNTISSDGDPFFLTRVAPSTPFSPKRSTV